MFIVLRPCDGFPDVSSVALTFVLFVWRCLPIRYWCECVDTQFEIFRRGYEDCVQIQIY